MPTTPTPVAFHGNVPGNNQIPLGMLNRIFTPTGPADQTSNTLYEILNSAIGLDKEENSRRDSTLKMLQERLGMLDKGFLEQERAVNRSLFSAAGDQFGSQSRGALTSLMGNIGARGIGFGSGASQALRGRIVKDKNRALIGSRRDIARDFTTRMTQHRQNAANFAAGPVASLMNQSPSMILQDRLGDFVNVFTRDRDRQAELDAAKKAGKANKTAQTIGTIGGLIGSFL